ncbi:hypothetical protein Tco_0625774 [Tanacetum coccineum]|uniref:Uncharacterized protein n=1 Tax=Tanacetum coccineum TaxID=301880 RepID=A0ABQ4WHP3_9ASTR
MVGSFKRQISDVRRQGYGVIGVYIFWGFWLLFIIPVGGRAVQDRIDRYGDLFSLLSLRTSTVRKFGMDDDLRSNNTSIVISDSLGESLQY